MTQKSRLVLQARREAADRVQDDLLMLEKSVNCTAIAASKCVASLLYAHAAAELPPAVGLEAIELIVDASKLATESRARMAAGQGVAVRAGQV